VWLSVWSEIQTCIWPSWCHCHSLSLASVKSRLVLPFWYRLTWVVPDKGPLNGCVCVCVCVSLKIWHLVASNLLFYLSINYWPQCLSNSWSGSRRVRRTCSYARAPRGPIFLQGAGPLPQPPLAPGMRFHQINNNNLVTSLHFWQILQKISS